MLLPGQVNAELGRRWKELSREEQEEYRHIGEDAALVEVQNEREDEIAALEAGAEVEAALVEVQREREREDEIAAVEAALEAGAEVEAALEAGTAEVEAALETGTAEVSFHFFLFVSNEMRFYYI